MSRSAGAATSPTPDCRRRPVNARYDLLGQVARAHTALYVLTAHTQDDQAETLLMRLVRGSGLVGLKAMERDTARGAVTIARPLLGIPKARLIATLELANIPFADDPTNRDVAYTRPRLRALLPALAAEGLTAESLSRLASRLQRADAALAEAAGIALQATRLTDQTGFDALRLAALPAEIRLRLLQTAIADAGDEGQADLGQIEALLTALDAAPRPAKNGVRLRRTLAGALITLTATRLLIAPAPPRRSSRKPPTP